MSQANLMGQFDMGGENLEIFNHCTVSEFLTCVKTSCFSINETQLPILQFMKSTLQKLKKEVDICFNYVIGHELQVRSNLKDCQVNVFAKNSKIEENDNLLIIHGLEDPGLLEIGVKKEIVQNFFANALEVFPEIVAVNAKFSKANKIVTFVEVASRKDKCAIFRNCHKLKHFGSKISVVDKFSKAKSKEKLKAAGLSTSSTNSVECVAVADIPEKQKKKMSSKHQCYEMQEEIISTLKSTVDDPHLSNEVSSTMLVRNENESDLAAVRKAEKRKAKRIRQKQRQQKEVKEQLNETYDDYENSLTLNAECDEDGKINLDEDDLEQLRIIFERRFEKNWFGNYQM